VEEDKELLIQAINQSSEETRKDCSEETRTEFQEKYAEIASD